MSRQTWRNEFYPETAISVKRKSWLACVEHCILKWRGLQKTNLKKHKVIVDIDRDVMDGGDLVLTINASSCSLCAKAVEKKKRVGSPERVCSYCPIFTITGSACDGDGSPWNRWLNRSDPDRMLKLLRSVRDTLRKEKKA